LRRKGLGKSERACEERGTEETEAGDGTLLEIFTELLDAEMEACEFEKELLVREREKGFAEKECTFF
jgi:hypothetical protein